MKKKKKTRPRAKVPEVYYGPLQLTERASERAHACAALHRPGLDGALSRWWVVLTSTGMYVRFAYALMST